DLALHPIPTLFPYTTLFRSLETALQVDPNFPAALNRLGYLYLDSSNPDPAKAVVSLKRYVEVAPTSPNPQDSLGEVLRQAGENRSEEHTSELQSRFDLVCRL